MVAMTTAQEYTAIRSAIQAFATGKTKVSYSIDGISVTYDVSQRDWLQSREIELASRLSCRNIRKRTTSDFSGGSGTYLEANP